MEQTKYKFNPFDFINNREKSIEPTIDELENFNNFSTMTYLSMFPRYTEIANRIFNTMQFSKLSKQHQCIAYTSLNGNHFPYVQYIKKGSSSKKVPKETIEKLCKLFNSTFKEVSRMIDDKFIDIDKALDLYAEYYEPNTLISNKTGKLLKKKS